MVLPRHGTAKILLPWPVAATHRPPAGGPDPSVGEKPRLATERGVAVHEQDLPAHQVSTDGVSSTLENQHVFWIRPARTPIMADVGGGSTVTMPRSTKGPAEIAAALAMTSPV